MDLELFESRKRDHIRHALDSVNQATGQSGLDQIVLVHEALPEINFADVSLKSQWFGKQTATPFYIAAMTAGHRDAIALNRSWAIAASERGWAMGVGSQRRELEGSSSLDQWKDLRKEVPNLTLFSNIGISQLIGADLEKIFGLVESLQAQAIGVHLNALQEAIQPEGTPFFKGALKAIEKICRAAQDAKIPVMIKETGCGFSRATLSRLANLGVSAVDISGLGGTHWGRIEGSRTDKTSKYHLASQTFGNWGVPTAQAVTHAKAVLPKSCEIWASGGVRSGLDAAKLIALGAHHVGYAKPALEAALLGDKSLQEWMELQEFELKVALFCTGSATVQALRDAPHALADAN
jgi:isopentenyl-diphosphate delta-isomerase